MPKNLNKKRSFVREGRHARVAPEANRLDIRRHKRELKTVKIKGT